MLIANEKEKRRAYGHRVIEIEHGSFTPLVFTSHGGCGWEADRFISELTFKLSEKRNISQSVVTNWVRTKLSFATIRAAILCIRGSRNRRGEIISDVDNIELANIPW